MVKKTRLWAATSPNDEQLVRLPMPLRDKELLSHWSFLMTQEAERILEALNAEPDATKRGKREAETQADKLIKRVQSLSDFTKLSTKNWVRKNLRM